MNSQRILSWLHSVPLNPRALAIASLACLLPVFAAAYPVDSDVRKRQFKLTKAELLELTPKDQRLSVRLSFSRRVSFRDYERLAKGAGFEPYDDCSVASFVLITHWQIIQGVDATPDQINAIVKQCQEQPETILGPKPISQAVGDQAILRGMWQRNLAFVGKGLRDVRLLGFVERDAATQFSELLGDPAVFTLDNEGFSRRPDVTVASAPSEADEDSEVDVVAEQAPEPTPEPVAATGTNVEIDRIILRTETRYGLGGTYFENETYLLLKDGTIHKNFSANPTTLDVTASRRASPKHWGRWQRQGQQLIVTWPGKDPVTWKKWFETRTANNEQRLQGKFQSADGFGGGRVANFNTVAFTEDGRFSWASLKGGSTGGWLPAYSDRRRAGRYELDRYSIRLIYNDGTIEEYAFCWYPKDNEHFVIGSSHFTPL